MKSFYSKFIILILTVISFSCVQTRYITEKHIKNNIENHQVGKQSNLKTYNIFKGNTVSGGRYLELIGYKLESEKGLVIGADRSYVTSRIKTPNGLQTESFTYIDFIQLDMDQAKSIISNYTKLQAKMKTERPRASEEIYHDFTVSEDCFISFRKSNNENGKDYINFWVKEEKYRISTSLFIKKLEKFIEY